MASRIVIDGNAFYEIDEDCMRRKQEQQEKQQQEKQQQEKQQRERSGEQPEKRRKAGRG